MLGPQATMLAPIYDTYTEHTQLTSMRREEHVTNDAYTSRRTVTSQYPAIPRNMTLAKHRLIVQSLSCHVCLMGSTKSTIPGSYDINSCTREQASPGRQTRVAHPVDNPMGVYTGDRLVQ